MGIAELGQPLARDRGGEGSPRQTRAGALGGRVGPSFWQGATGLVISASSCAWREGPGSRCRHCPQPPRAACSAIPRGQSGSLHLWKRGGRAAGAGVWQRSPLRGQQGGQEHRARPSSREGRVPGWWCAPPCPALTQLLAPPVQQAEPETPHTFHLGPPQVSPCRIPQLHSRQVLRALPRPRPPHARPQMPQLPPTEHVLLGGGLGLGWAETCPLPPSSSEGCWD